MEDLVMRKYIKEQLMSAAVSSIVIERCLEQCPHHRSTLPVRGLSLAGKGEAN